MPYTNVYTITYKIKGTTQYISDIKATNVRSAKSQAREFLRSSGHTDNEFHIIGVEQV